ncbi:Gcf1 protein [Candida orthopsilosis Co 90-125]|uniref:Gcf1 protein n=1 Tax=Candida orthopsilosis (strain 90-125) TaxID=1136231 RepID=H8WX56_CANO9|nr:Gcf1 protein [Candida orthopsilosis Co 90-125]CCG21361.1 Gcf1 protein [Candida orthopsilosis Co 90-125]
MMRLMINPGRALATQFTYKPIFNASIPHQAVKFLTTKTTKSSKDKVLEHLKKKLKTAKEKRKTIEQELKEKNKQIRDLISQRKKEASTKEKAKLKEKKDAEKRKAHLKDTLREPRPLTTRNFFAKATKTPVTTLNGVFDALSQSEKEQYQKATDEYNQALKSILTPKPVLGPITGYQNYVSQNYPPGVSSDVAMRELADKWRLLTKEEKKSYDVPEHEVNRIKTIQKNWEETREKEYPTLIKFKEEYKFTI